MADIRTLTVEGVTYNIKDATARADITPLQTNVTQLQTNVTQLQQNTEDLPQIRENVENNADDIRDLKIAVAKYQIYDTASGSIASFSDGADDEPIKELIVNVDPVQDLHGYISPWPGGGRKNLFQTTAMSDTINGTTFTVHDDGSISVSGKPSAAISTYSFGIVTLPAGTYIVNGFADGSDNIIRMSVYDRTASEIIANIYGGRERTFTLESEAEIRIYPIVRTAFDGTEVTFYPMIRKSTEADSSFVPYENICPITGWTQAKVTRTGKNFFDEINAVIYKRYFRVDSDRNFWSYLADASSFVMQCEPNQTYTISCDNPGISIFRVGYITENPDNLLNSESTEIYGSIKKTESGSITITTGNEAKYLVIQINSSILNTRNTKLQIELGSVATAYKPFGNTYNITFPNDAGTVYGGTLDTSTGKLKVNKRYVLLNDANKWVSSSYTTLDYNYTDLFSDRKIYSDSFTGLTSSYIKTILQGDSYGCWNSASGSVFGIHDANITLEQIKADATAGKIAICYDIATPIEYTLTAQQINTLLGQNNIWADTGNVSVTYPADLKLYIDKKVAQ